MRWVRGWERVGAFCDGGGVESCAQERHVGRLVRGDFLQVVSQWVSEAGVDKVLLDVVSETFTVELVFEMLKGERVVADFDWKLVSGKRGKGNDSCHKKY
jgi:hypothetical protein